ncbi:MAG: HAMP domain-containing histidine kinase, partial [Nitrospirota bacterium]|nr:HAMP domain-containing histidine kinase [Nitrospirota bacterium]
MQTDPTTLTTVGEHLIDAGRSGIVVIDRALEVRQRRGALVQWVPLGGTVTSALPFLVGYEQSLADVMAGARARLGLPRIGWQGGPFADDVLSLEVLPGLNADTAILWFQDETEVARLEQQVLQQRNELALANGALEEAHARAEEAHRAKSAFFANISHDLKTPLQVIIGNAEILRNEAGANGAREETFLRDIEDSGQFLMSLIVDLLEVAALESGDLAMVEEPTELGALVDQSLAMVRALPDAEGRHFSVSMPDERWLIMADPVRLKRVLVNLLGNAVKFTRDDGRIGVQIDASPDGGLVLQVRDDGCGMDADLERRALEPF